MSWNDLDGFSTFEKARRKEVGRRLTRLVRGKEPDRLLELDEVRTRLHLYEQWYVGFESIEVAKIVGSVDRSTDFDRRFLPKRGGMEKRWKNVENTFRGQAFPPIIAFRVGDGYFVEDGHHRVAIARQRGDEFIDAEITEVKSPVSITSDTDVAAVVHMGLRQWFMDHCQLDRVRPRAEIQPSRPRGYAELLDIVFASGFELMMSRNAMVTPAQASAHWYDDLYMPAVASIRNGSLPTMFPHASDTDLYLRVHEQHRVLQFAGAPRAVEDVVHSTETEASKAVTAKTRLVLEDVKEKLKSAVEDGHNGGGDLL